MTLVQGQEKFIEEIKTLKEDNKKLIKRVVTLESNIEKLERTERKNSIVIKGANIRKDMVTVEFLKTELGVLINIISAKIIKTKYAHPIVIAKLEEWDQKMQIMKNKTKLKGKPIYIDDDLIPKKIQTTIREIQFIKKIWMLYAQEHWTKAFDLKSAVERLYEELGALEFDADHEAIYGMERYYTVQECEELRNKYKIGRKV
ncbi:hypothetical protein FQA39_LY15986 [Lamprigera yunnana]|nr:hypothetical protein FQA39_LY15986 [Lamprigera yunnana]